MITRSITRPLNVALGAAQRIARGDLSQAVPVSGRDEAGRPSSGTEYHTGTAAQAGAHGVPVPPHAACRTGPSGAGNY